MDQKPFFGTRARQLCEMLAIDVPIIQAPMAGGWTTPELVAAVSNAGGLGMLAAARLSAAELEATIVKTRSLTSRQFGVNFLLAPAERFDGDLAPVQARLDPLRRKLGLPPGTAETTLPPPQLQRQYEIVLEQEVPIVSFAMGVLPKFVARLKDAGVKVLGMATTVAEAQELAAGNVDGIVAQGAEAGGHRSTFRVSQDRPLPLIGTLALVPQMVDRVDLPIVAAGGIMDGRGLAAALALGASGVQMGTRFLTAFESGAFADYRRRLLAAADSDTVITWSLTGRPARALRNDILTALDEALVDPLPWPYPAVAANDIYTLGISSGQGDYAPLLAGQGARLAAGEASAGQIVAETVAQARQVLSQLDRIDEPHG